VVRSSGLPLGVRHSLLRNLLRIVDSLPPPFCIVGAVSVIASRKGQRLGDLAEGTVVIRERFRASREPDTGGERAAGVNADPRKFAGQAVTREPEPGNF
jgi:uncharacterized RDD family membrane protein YckC